MFLKSLGLINFRNYAKLDFKFTTGTTILLGDNAQGKSNFLESIYFLSTAKSPKADRDEELIKEGGEFLRVEGNVEVGLEISMQLIEGRLKKRVKVNGIPKRVVDYSENLVVILFTPEDINLVNGPPSIRRQHIDHLLSQVDKSYKKTLHSYEGVVTNKNRILKNIQEGTAKTDQLIFWSDQQVLLGTLISEKRKNFFVFLKENSKDFQFEYKQSLVTTERLREYLSREVASSNSLIGPHRDDFYIFLGERDLSTFGSRGEQRTAVLDLKLLEINYIESILGDKPVLLLDDIFSELDHAHSKHVIEISKLQQTIITAVELDPHLQQELAEATFYRVENGQITRTAHK